MIDAASFSIRVGNRLPYLACKFGFSLVGAVGVTFSMRDRFILSLNDVPQVREIFGAFELREVTTVYTMSRTSKGTPREELLISNFPLPSG